MQQFSYFCKNVNCHSVDSNLGAMSSPPVSNGHQLMFKASRFSFFYICRLFRFWSSKISISASGLPIQ